MLSGFGFCPFLLLHLCTLQQFHGNTCYGLKVNNHARHQCSDSWWCWYVGMTGSSAGLSLRGHLKVILICQVPMQPVGAAYLPAVFSLLKSIFEKSTKLCCSTSRDMHTHTAWRLCFLFNWKMNICNSHSNALWVSSTLSSHRRWVASPSQKEARKSVYEYVGTGGNDYVASTTNYFSAAWTDDNKKTDLNHYGFISNCVFSKGFTLVWQHHSFLIERVRNSVSKLLRKHD